jgi:hypothetical protein
MSVLRLLGLSAILGASVHCSIAQDARSSLTTIYNSGSMGDLVFGASNLAGENTTGCYAGLDCGATSDYGTAFELTPPATPDASDGANPWTSLVIGKNGALYGATAAGLLNGTWFELNP